MYSEACLGAPLLNLDERSAWHDIRSRVEVICVLLQGKWPDLVEVE